MVSLQINLKPFKTLRCSVPSVKHSSQTPTPVRSNPRTRNSLPAMTSFSFLFPSNADSATSTPDLGSFTFGSSASTSSYLKTDLIGSFTFGSSASTSAVDNSSAFRFRKKHIIGKKGCKCRISPTRHTSDAPVFAAQALVKANPYDTKLSTVSSETKATVDEIKQNRATRKANTEPVTNSPLPLTLVSRILNGIPQNPHFFQLRNYSELTRAKLISAWDQVFEETVNEIHSLEAVNFWVRAKKLWKAMEELQNVGYNVIALRKRLVELSDVVIELKLSESVIKGLKIKAENHRMERSRLESLIVSLQAMAKREEDRRETKLIASAKLENDLPKFDAALAKLAMDPL